MQADFFVRFFINTIRQFKMAVNKSHFFRYKFQFLKCSLEVSSENENDKKLLKMYQQSKTSYTKFKVNRFLFFGFLFPVNFCQKLMNFSSQVSSFLTDFSAKFQTQIDRHNHKLLQNGTINSKTSKFSGKPRVARYNLTRLFQHKSY